MKIAIIHNQFKGGGGMEAYMLALVRGFLAAGDEVHLHTYVVDTALASTVHCQLHKQCLSFLPRRWQKYVFLHRCNSRFRRCEYDLSLGLTRTHAPDIAIVGGVHPASVAMRSGFSHPLRRLHDRIETAFERRMLARVPAVVAHSASLAGEIRHYYPTVESSKISVLYPPIDTDFFQAVRGEALRLLRERYGLDEKKLTLLFPSTGHRRKGLDELLNAMGRLDPKRFELLVAGEQMPGRLALPENVHYLGYVQNLSGLYSAVDYTVLPSHYEPFGLVVVESLHCGTPVLVSKMVGAAELLNDQEAVVLESNHPDLLAEAIEQLEPMRVEAGFVERHGLSLSQHIEQLKKVPG